MNFIRNIVCYLLSKPLGLVIAIGVPLLVLSWHAFAKPRHFDDVLRELGSVRQIRGIPTPNHAGDKLVFAQTMESEVGIYLRDLATKQNQLVDKYPPTGKYTFLGWSPNDEYFALHTGFFLRIYQAKTGTLMAQISSPNLAGGGWLSNKAIFVSDKSGSLYRVGLEEWQWGMQKPFLAFRGGHKLPGRRDNVVALDADEVAWRDGNCYWALDVNSATPRKLCEAPAGVTILDSGYVQGLGKFLLLCRDSTGKFLASLGIGSSAFERLETPQDIDPSQFSWVGSKGGYVCSGVASSGKLKLSLKISPDVPAVTTEWTALWAVSCNEKGIYIVGAQSAHPTEIWEYDLVSRSLNSIISNCEQAFKYTRLVEPQSYDTQTADGQRITFDLYQPAQFTPRKKYPVVICEGPRNYEQVVANSGAFCASVLGLGPERRPRTEDYLAVFEALRSNPSIDTRKVCWMGSSKGVGYILSLIGKKGGPEDWKGAILLNAGPITPNFENLNVQRLLIDYGSLDLTPSAEKILKSFQNQATALGVSVSLLRHPGEGHTLNSLRADSRRKRAIAQFVRNLN